MKQELIETLDIAKATLRGAMVALKSNLENWERKEFEAVRTSAIHKIRVAVRGLAMLAAR